MFAIGDENAFCNNFSVFAQNKGREFMTLGPCYYRHSKSKRFDITASGICVANPWVNL